MCSRSFKQNILKLLAAIFHAHMEPISQVSQYMFQLAPKFGHIHIIKFVLHCLKSFALRCGQMVLDWASAQPKRCHLEWIWTILRKICVDRYSPGYFPWPPPPPHPYILVMGRTQKLLRMLRLPSPSSVFCVIFFHNVSSNKGCFLAQPSKCSSKH